MKDQAERLRKKINQTNSRSVSKTMAVVSGKGGVGKSNFSLNFAISLIGRGHKVLLFDMDVGMGNIDILMGKATELSIVDFFEGKKLLNEIVVEGPESLQFIAGGTGLEYLIKLDEGLMDRFLAELAVLFSEFEYVIFDMGAGVSEQYLNLLLSVDEIVVVTTPEPTAIMDAYSMMKHIHLLNANLPFLIVINRVIHDNDGIETFKRLRTAARTFLGRDVNALGIIPEDREVTKAVSTQTPFIFIKKSSAAKAILKMSERYEKKMTHELPVPVPMSFITKLKRLIWA